MIKLALINIMGILINSSKIISVTGLFIQNQLINLCNRHCEIVIDYSLDEIDNKIN